MVNSLLVSCYLVYVAFNLITEQQCDCLSLLRLIGLNRLILVVSCLLGINYAKVFLLKMKALHTLPSVLHKSLYCERDPRKSISIRRKCELMDVNRCTLQEKVEKNLEVIRLMEERHLRHPAYGVLYPNAAMTCRKQ